MMFGMAKRKTTVYLDEEVLREAKVQAARKGQKDSELIEEAVRSYLGLDVLDEVWARSDLDEEAALRLASEALEAARRSG
jgi:metal-responsive CopG/Arc/MetJ family transcriptional regulator